MILYWLPRRYYRYVHVGVVITDGNAHACIVLGQLNENDVIVDYSCVYSVQCNPFTVDTIGTLVTVLIAGVSYTIRTKTSVHI